MQIGDGGISTVILGLYNPSRIVYDPSQFQKDLFGVFKV